MQMQSFTNTVNTTDILMTIQLPVEWGKKKLNI